MLVTLKGLRAIWDVFLKIFVCVLKAYWLNQQSIDISFVGFQIYEFLVLETKPGNAVSIIECDMQVQT